MELEELFWEIDDFCVEFEHLWEEQLLPKQGQKQRRRQSSLSLSEVMTIIGKDSGLGATDGIM